MPLDKYNKNLYFIASRAFSLPKSESLSTNNIYEILAKLPTNGTDKI